MYEDEQGPAPEPAEMTGPCEHNQHCPVCKSGFRVENCGHKFADAPLFYQIAVNGPMEVR
jgi:hypothetical protein